jgi:hypothetical protein
MIRNSSWNTQTTNLLKEIKLGLRNIKNTNKREQLKKTKKSDY